MSDYKKFLIKRGDPVAPRKDWEEHPFMQTFTSKEFPYFNGFAVNDFMHENYPDGFLDLNKPLGQWGWYLNQVVEQAHAEGEI